MKKIFLMTILSLALTGCDRPEKPVTRPPIEEDSDNTGVNVRDRDPMAKTPWDQSETEADRTITQNIRRAIMADDDLSTNAKNIKIITIKGVVTLRGPVANLQEKDVIESKIDSVPGVVKVVNLLDVVLNK